MAVTLTAALCPAIQQPASMLSILGAATGDGNSLVAKRTLAAVTWRNDTANPNATILDRIASEGGCNAHAVSGDFPPVLSIGTGLALAVSAGEAFIGGPVQLAATTVVVPDATARVWIWLKQIGTLAAVATSLTPPAGAQCLLGSCTTAGGVVTAVDSSGVLFLKGGALWRQTADAGKPTDSPPASVVHLVVTAGGTYLWNGSAYCLVPMILSLSQQNVASGELPVIPAGYQAQLFGDVQITGHLKVYGRQRITT